MNVEKAKHIYEVARQENIPEDIILAMEGIDPQEYEEALALYLKTLEETQEFFDFDEHEEEPMGYECYFGSYIADIFLW